jgi:hypothetical protein
MQTFTRPTDEALLAFSKWLEPILKHPEHSVRHAKVVADEHDWDRTRTVEVRGIYTISGNPTTYTFDDDDMISEDIG